MIGQERNERMEGKNRILWYGIPAYGHVNANLYFAGCLAREGFHVVYYATEEFRSAIEANGCEFCSYPILQKEIDLSDGEKILKLYRLILQYTLKMLPTLVREAEREKPCGIVFDSLALWGRVVKDYLQVPGFSFYSIIAISHIGDKGFWAYGKGFSADFLRYAGEIPRAVRLKRELQRNWGKMRLGLLDVLMNKGDKNFMGYSRLFQPGGDGLGEEYQFLGPLAVHRKSIGENDFVCPKEKVIYISLGTIFNQNEWLMREMVNQLGRKRGQRAEWVEEYTVILVWPGQQRGGRASFPDNFIVRDFVNQGKILRYASLFITAGGMNSIHEALYYGVPCLMCPQQGEQRINAGRFEKLGFGRILRNPGQLKEEARQTMRLKTSWSEKRRKEIVMSRVGSSLRMFQKSKKNEGDERNVR